MDRELDPAINRNLLIKRILIGALIVIIGSFIVNFIYGIIRPSVSRSNIITAVVESGRVTETISASGTVVPIRDQVLVSPVETKVLSILKQPGDILTEGHKILDIDMTALKLSSNKIDEQILLKQNQKERLNNDLEKMLTDYESQSEINRLKFESAKYNHDLQNRLFEMGGSSKEMVRKAKMDMDIAGIEVKRAEDNIENLKKSTATNSEGLELERSLLIKDREDIRRRLSLGDMKAEQDGILTWVVDEVGASVRQGEVLARISDLSAFQIESTISDIHAAKLILGMPVQVKININETISGNISSIRPMSVNGITTFIVQIDESASSYLRPNMRVDVNVVLSEVPETLRIKRGSFAQGGGVYDVFVIRGDNAYRTSVQFGISSFEYLEIIKGLEAGEEVIISDMDDMLRLITVKVN